MTTQYRYLFLYTFVFLSFCTQLLAATNVKNSLEKADSLFGSKKYTESFALYDSIFEQGFYTNSMLLKMAFIKEGLGDYSNALYYLDFYIKKTSDHKAIDKMEELAEKYKLEGYEKTDGDYFISLFNRYLNSVKFLLLALAVLFLVLAFKQKAKGLKPYGPAFSLLFVLGTLFFLNTQKIVPSKGLVISNSTYVMSGPSSGSDVREVISKGHKVSILKSGSIWTKIRWKNQDAFVRSNMIKEFRNA